MHIICSDLEGVFVPEIWINFAEITGIEELRLTTRDISDYNVLMKHRLDILSKNGLKLGDIQGVIAKMEPMDGALAFINWLRAKTQLIIVSDTFTEFAGPLMEKLAYPTLLCNTLTVGADGTIEDYNLRQADGKRRVVRAFQDLNYRIIGIGDSYNDITMLQAADAGILYRPPDKVKAAHDQFQVATSYAELKEILQSILAGTG